MAKRYYNNAMKQWIILWLSPRSALALPTSECGRILDSRAVGESAMAKAYFEMRLFLGYLFAKTV